MLLPARLALRVRGFLTVKLSAWVEPRISVAPPTLNVSTFFSPAVALPSALAARIPSSRNSIAEATCVKSSRFCRAPAAREAVSRP